MIGGYEMVGKKRAWWIMELFALFLLLTVSGCGRQGRTGQETEGHTNEREQPELYDYADELPADYEGTLSMWGWDDRYVQAVTDAFCEKYPNVTIEYVPVENGDLFQNYQTAMLTGDALPDIGWALLAYRSEIFELDIWEALDGEPYCFSLDDVYPVLHSRMVNSKGNVCGIEQALTVAGLAYRRDLAQQYLGTDDPQVLEAMLPDWEHFMEKGAAVYESSGGEACFLRSVAEVQNFLREQQEAPWVQQNTVKLTETLQESIETAVKLRDTHTSDCLEAWTPEWYESIGGERYLFIAAAPWSIEFEIERYDPEGKDSGRWGLMRAPGGSIFWGGTTMGITKTCRDKRLAWEFIRFATLSGEGAEVLREIGMFTTALQPYEDNPDLRNYYNDWFGEQNVGAYFLDVLLPEAYCRELSMQDGVVHDALNLINAALQQDRNMTSGDAQAYLKSYLQEKLKGYQIE